MKWRPMRTSPKSKVKRKALWTTLPAYAASTTSKPTSPPRKPLRRTRVRPRSKAMKRRLQEYWKLAARFLADHPHCKKTGCKKPSKDVHHTRGRAGELLLDWRLWLPLCREDHDWVRDNPAAARSAGLLCEKGKWNEPLPTPIPEYTSP